MDKLIEHRVAVDGVTTRVLEQGRGPATVLLHGGSLGCSADDWREALAPIAASGFRALVFDQPGFGACDEPSDVSVSYRLRFIPAFLDALAIDRATLVGHSQGGRLVFSTALNAAERVTAGIVVCTGSLLPPLDGNAGGGVETPSHEPTLAETRAYLESVVYHREYVTDALVARFHGFSTGRNYRYAGERESAASGKGGDGSPLQPWQRLAELSPPAMLVYGANDRGRVPERVRLARERYPALPIHLLEQCGHFAQWDQPDALIRLIIEFARPAGGVHAAS